MARKGKQRKGDQPETNRGEVPLVTGFRRSIVSGEGGAWFRPEDGAYCRGILVGRFTMRKLGKDGKPRNYYQLRLTEDGWGVTGKGKSAKPVKLAKGSLLNVDERTALEGLKKLTDDTSTQYEVIITALEKIQLESGNSFWRFDVQDRPIGAAAAGDDDGEDEGDDTDD